MLKQDLVSRISRRLSLGSSKTRKLHDRAGKAAAPASAFEALEPRILLSGDHPGIDEVFGPSNTPPTVIPILMDGTGVGLGQIGDVPNDTGDFFQFTATQDGFVSVLAQTLGSGLDSALELYQTDGTKISADTAGLDNGTTARGFDSDGWLGFIAEAGETYYLRVLGESGTTGVYAVHINTANTGLTLDSTTGYVRTGSGTGQQESISTLQEDVLYTFTTPDLEKFDSLGSIMAGDVVFGDDMDGYVGDPEGVRDLIDTRVELYDAEGNLIGADSSSGYNTDAFLLNRFERNTTYYVRVRSDAFTVTNVSNPQSGLPDNVAAGEFELRIQAAATDFPLDNVTRLGVIPRLGGMDDPGVGLLRDQHSAQIYTFESLGTGRTIINFTTFDSNLQPGWDPKIALYDAATLTPIATNDTAFTLDAFDRAEIDTNLQGGERYFVIVDAFDGPILNVTDPARDIDPGERFFQMVIESNATIDRSDTDQPIDDHIDVIRDDDGEITNQSVIRQLATPLIWGSAYVPTGWSVPLTDDVDLDGDGFGDVYGLPGFFGPSPRYFSALDFPNAVTDHSLVVASMAWGRLDTSNDTDVFTFVPQVDHLGRFEGSLQTDMDDNEIEPNLWNIDGRPASRITIAVEFEIEWVQTGTVAIQLYDSNFNLVVDDFETPLQSVNTDTGGPAGVDSPSLLGPDPTGLRKVDLAVTLDAEYWGGESYYVVISAPGSRTRYNMTVQADAQNDTYGTNSEAPEEDDFEDAEQLIFDNFSGLATTTGNPGFVTDSRSFGVESGIDPADLANFFDLIVQDGELGKITDINDTDVYKFVAPRSGTAEILLSTTNIVDTFRERFINSGLGITVSDRTVTKTYNSPLDAALRVFDSNGNQVAYVNDFLGYTADGTTITLGDGFNPNLENVQVFRKDPRIVLDVQQGQEYFVVVESSQRWRANADAADPADRIATNPNAGNIDWRVATGSYQLIVNATPQSVTDDHAGTIGAFQETVIPFNSNPNSPNNGTGSVSGLIHAQNDFDSFTFMAPVDGLLTLTLDPSAALSVAITVFDGNGELIFLPNSTAVLGEPLTVSFAVNQAERYAIRIFGLTGTGSYTMNLSGLPVADDVPDEGRFYAAQELDFGDFSRIAETSGILNQGGDSDIFYFDAVVTDLATVTIERQSGQPAMSPAVVVYELGEDNYPTPMPLNHVIAWDLNPDGAGRVSIDFSTQAGRRYFIVAKGSDPSNSLGAYDLTVEYDPEDDHADIGQLDDATFVNIVPSTGTGSATGILEQSNDSDLFVFGVPTTGPVDISLVWDDQPGATFELRIYDIDGNTYLVNGMAGTYTSDSGFLAIPQFTGMTADIFYVAVVGPTASRIDYTLNINTGLVDDHANDMNFDDATVIPLDFNTGDGSSSGRLEVDDDTDFFTFDILDTGLFTIDISKGTIATLDLKLYDSSMNLVAFTVVDADTIQYNNVDGPLETYYLSIGSTFPGIRTGSYTVNVDGPPIAPAPEDDHVNQGNLAGATVLDVNAINGNASDTGIIDNIIDTDLFRYDTIGRGELYIQVVSGDVPTPDFTVRIFNASGVEITELANSTGVSGVMGVTAATSFVSSGAGQTFYILVDSTADTDIGNYTLRVDGPALTTRTYYPEGFANAGIHEFISLANPNDEAVSYSITVYYADMTLGSAVVATGTLAAGARGGTTLSYGADIDNDGNADFAPGIIANEAYAIVVESTLRLGASLSHYDANLARTGAIGEAFSDQTANRWDFPDVVRNPGVVEEFLVYYNPNPFDVELTVTAYTGSGATVVLPVMTLGANKRGGLEIHNTSALPLGTFSIEITSTPVDSANNAADLGVIAGISRYNLVNRFAFGYLGIRDGGSTTNIITKLTNGTDITSEFTIFNASGTDATVDIVGTYLEDSALPTLIRQVTVGAGERLRLTGTDLAFVNNEAIGLKITSNTDIAISSIERQRGDADATGAFTEAGTSFYFGDAFMNPLRAGNLYTETLAFYNPNDADTDVTITFFFADGSAERVRMETVAADDFLLLRLENVAQVVQSRPQLNYYAMRIDATSGVVVSMTHYDGFLGGGWGTGGAPLGLTSSIA